MTAHLVDVWQDWECPRCGLTDRTRPLQPGEAARMHDCPQLHGLSAPLVPAGTDCTLVAVERGDYLNGDEQRTGNDGKPYMAIRTDYADGHNDLVVYPGVAVFGAQAGKA
jgi:hypothetical protein